MKPLLPSVRDSLELAAATFERELAEAGARPAVEYLVGRGIDRSTAESFRLGYVATADVPGFERFVGRLAIPNICAAGHVVGFKFRALPPEDADTDRKYDGLDMPVRLFNLRALNDAEDVIWVTEGEIDAISLSMLGAPTVAVPGANNWKKHHARILEGFDRVVLVRDDDDAGLDLAKKIGATDLPLLTVRPPRGYKDVNAALAAGARDQLEELIERTRP